MFYNRGSTPTPIGKIGRTFSVARTLSQAALAPIPDAKPKSAESDDGLAAIMNFASALGEVGDKKSGW